MKELPILAAVSITHYAAGITLGVLSHNEVTHYLQDGAFLVSIVTGTFAAIYYYRQNKKK